MKREKILSCLTAGVLALCLGFGGVACMVTGLKLPSDWASLGFGCVLGAAVAAVCFSFKRGGLVLGGIGAAFGAVMALNDRFQEQLRAMLYSMFHYYNLGYGIEIPEWFNGAAADTQVLPLLLIAGLVMTVTAWAVLRRRSVIAPVAVALLPLTSCLVVTDTVPAAFAVFIYLLGLTLLIMTAAVRRWDGAQGNRLAAILALPVAAALTLLMLAVPRDEFQGPAQGGSFDSLIDWFSGKLPTVDTSFEGELVISFGTTAKNKVDLSSMGRNSLSGTPVMEIVSEQGGKIYLRGRSYDGYDGKCWAASSGGEETFQSPGAGWLTDSAQLTVKMLSKRGQYYLPVYPAKAQTLQNGMVPNSGYEMEYSFSWQELRSDWKQMYSPQLMTGNDYDAYLELPEQTRLRAQEYLGSIANTPLPLSPYSYDYLQTATQIEAHVSSAAGYDLNTGRMPDDEEDFALWFLEQSDTGYCVHFATAATVLLRAAGIPARYVEGYTAQTEAGQKTVVRENQAHAWVEYYVPGIGWVIMDPTPGGGEAGGTETTAPSQTTGPIATEPSTADPVQPSTGDGTGPSATGDSTGPTGSGTVIPSVPGDEDRQTLPEWFGTMLLWLAVSAAAVAAVIGQWALRRRSRLRRMHSGRPNAQALARLREAARMAKLRGIPVPDALQALAEKARFSQHTLTQEELARFDTFLQESVGELKKKPWYWRLVYRLVYAAY